jgi:hypothetical protein
MYFAKPKILKAGNTMNCIHRENVVGDKGTCLKCGQVKQYPRFDMPQDTKRNKKNTAHINPKYVKTTDKELG